MGSVPAKSAGGWALIVPRKGAHRGVRALGVSPASLERRLCPLLTVYDLKPWKLPRHHPFM